MNWNEFILFFRLTYDVIVTDRNDNDKYLCSRWQRDVGMHVDHLPVTKGLWTHRWHRLVIFYICCSEKLLTSVLYINVRLIRLRTFPFAMGDQMETLKKFSKIQKSSSHTSPTKLLWYRISLEILFQKLPMMYAIKYFFAVLCVFSNDAVKEEVVESSKSVSSANLLTEFTTYSSLIPDSSLASLKVSETESFPTNTKQGSLPGDIAIHSEQKTLEESLTVKTSPKACMLPAVTGSCSKAKVLWYYNFIKGRCERFSFRWQFLKYCGFYGNVKNTWVNVYCLCYEWNTITAF